ncbi:hypothetical protein JOB18_018058 [Solea senegalensis]|uniref:Uncharacterized protein n=1 Tax=Solea senegalensis TaxID=28829 RepID=A0AAV6QPG5_SOLSE|nr:hypothetical protein JOB18_018058 [Solea senegalensis]
MQEQLMNLQALLPQELEELTPALTLHSLHFSASDLLPLCPTTQTSPQFLVQSLNITHSVISISVVEMLELGRVDFEHHSFKDSTSQSKTHFVHAILSPQDHMSLALLSSD